MKLVVIWSATTVKGVWTYSGQKDDVCSCYITTIEKWRNPVWTEKKVLKKVASIEGVPWINGYYFSLSEVIHVDDTGKESLLFNRRKFGWFVEIPGAYMPQRNRDNGVVDYLTEED
jgi:hypothetical protein